MFEVNVNVFMLEVNVFMLEVNVWPLKTLQYAFVINSRMYSKTTWFSAKYPIGRCILIGFSLQMFISKRN